jgi:hypothetical protein
MTYRTVFPRAVSRQGRISPYAPLQVDVAANEGYFDPVRADVGDKIHHLGGEEHQKHQGYWHQVIVDISKAKNWSSVN